MTILACGLGLAVLVQLIVNAYEAEQKRIAGYLRELAAADESYRALYNSMRAGIFIYTEDGRLKDVNDGACDMFRCTREEFLGRPPARAPIGLSPGEQPALRETLRASLGDRSSPISWHARRKDGQEFWSEIYTSSADVGGARMMVATVRDISERVAAEEAVKLNAERLRMALAASKQGWFDIDIQTGEGTASSEYAQIIGLEAKDFRVTKGAWLEGIHPDDRKMMSEEFAACVRNGGPRVMEYRRKTAAGEWKWIRSIGKIVEWDEAGRPVRMIGTHADVTERRRLESQLLHSQRLDSVGTLAGGVAHDLNNILTPMLMAGPAIREKLENPDDRALMAQMESGARRGAEIVKQLLAFSRDMAEKRVPVDTLQVLREMKAIMQGTFPKSIAIEVGLTEDLWPVMADPVQFHQVMMNLCINARDAMPEGGRLRLTAENMLSHTGRTVILSVSDTGHGIPQENLGRIFDPFFTTKEVGKGTGLGLSVVHGILKSHGGSVTVESEVGKGSTFRVTFPAAESAPHPAVKTPDVPVLMGRKAVVAVVDDENLVLRVTVRALESQGYEVLSSTRARDMVEQLERRSGPVDLLLTDIMMPEMDGPTLAATIKGTYPSMRVIGVSGLNLEPRTHELRAIGFAEILRKPYDLDELLGAVRRQLPGVDKGPVA